MMTPIDKVETNEDANEDAGTKENTGRVPPWVRKWCYCCGSCTGTLVVLGVVNGFTIFSLWLMGSLLNAILEHSGSNVVYKYRAVDIVVFLVTQFSVCVMNLLAIYCLCRRYNSAGRDYKAMLHVFCCWRRTNRRVYPETIRPVRDVVSDICSNGACVRWIFRGCGITFLVALVVLFATIAAHTSEQGTMLVWLGLISFFLWIVVFVLLFTKGGVEQQQPEEEVSQRKGQASPSEESAEAIQTQVSKIEIEIV